MRSNRAKQALKVALVVFGLVFVFGVPALMMLWPDAWAWEPRQPEYEWMIMGVYATLGVFLIIAARRPLEHRLLIHFTVWSSVVHATIMLVEALIDPTERANLIGDIPALFVVALVLGLLLRKATARERERETPPEIRAPMGSRHAHA